MKAKLLKIVYKAKSLYKCKWCSKSFRYNRKRDIESHILAVHDMMKKYECKSCKKEYTNSANLARHRQGHDKKGNTCSYCSKSFTTKGAVKKHETIHKVDKKHACTLCEKAFARADHLKSHMKSHQKQEGSVSSGK